MGNLKFDQNYPAVMSCKADGFTRMDGTASPFASDSSTTASPVATTILPATTTLAATTTPVATTTTVSETCTVKFYEGNGGNQNEWTYTVTVNGRGAAVEKDWRKSSKNDELTSLCISQPGCKVELYENKKFKGTPKRFIGTDHHNRGCGTFISKTDLNTRQTIQGVGTTGRFNDKTTSWRVTAAGW